MAIYVIGSNSYKKNIYKIGFTTDSKDSLITRYQTSLGNVNIKYFTKCDNPRQREGRLHQRLDKYRLYPKHELFKCKIGIVRYHMLHAVDAFSKYSLIKQKWLTTKYKFLVIAAKLF